jgi:hypothetical protein
VTAAVAVVLITLPLPWARRWPLPALLVVLMGALLEYSSDAGLGQTWFAILLAVYALGSWGSARSSAIGMSVVAVGTLAIDIPRLQQGAGIDDVVPGWVILAGTWGLGTRPSLRTTRRWSGTGRRQAEPRSPTSGPGSPASSTTSWPTAWR